MQNRAVFTYWFRAGWCKMELFPPADSGSFNAAWSCFPCWFGVVSCGMEPFSPADSRSRNAESAVDAEWRRFPLLVLGNLMWNGAGFPWWLRISLCGMKLFPSAVSGLFNAEWRKFSLLVPGRLLRNKTAEQNCLCRSTATRSFLRWKELRQCYIYDNILVRSPRRSFACIAQSIHTSRIKHPNLCGILQSCEYSLFWLKLMFVWVTS